jgi:hypothetical protein
MSLTALHASYSLQGHITTAIEVNEGLPEAAGKANDECVE